MSLASQAQSGSNRAQRDQAFIPSDPRGKSAECVPSGFANPRRARAGSLAHGVDNLVHLRAPNSALLPWVIRRARLRLDDLPHLAHPLVSAEKYLVRQLAPEAFVAFDFRADELLVVRPSLVSIGMEEFEQRAQVEPIRSVLVSGGSAIARPRNPLVSPPYVPARD